MPPSRSRPTAELPPPSRPVSVSSAAAAVLEEEAEKAGKQLVQDDAGSVRVVDNPEVRAYQKPARAPRVGDQVWWYRLNKVLMPDGQPDPGGDLQPLAGTITQVVDPERGLVNLCVHTPTGGAITSRNRCRYADPPRVLCWGYRPGE